MLSLHLRTFKACASSCSSWESSNESNGVCEPRVSDQRTCTWATATILSCAISSPARSFTSAANVTSADATTARSMQTEGQPGAAAAVGVTGMGMGLGPATELAPLVFPQQTQYGGAAAPGNTTSATDAYQSQSPPQSPAVSPSAPLQPNPSHYGTSTAAAPPSQFAAPPYAPPEYSYPGPVSMSASGAVATAPPPSQYSAGASSSFISYAQPQQLSVPSQYLHPRPSHSQSREPLLASTSSGAEGMTH